MMIIIIIIDGEDEDFLVACLTFKASDVIQLLTIKNFWIKFEASWHR